MCWMVTDYQNLVCPDANCYNKHNKCPLLFRYDVHVTWLLRNCTCLLLILGTVTANAKANSYSPTAEKTKPSIKRRAAQRNIVHSLKCLSEQPQTRELVKTAAFTAVMSVSRRLLPSHTHTHTSPVWQQMNKWWHQEMVTLQFRFYFDTVTVCSICS